MQHNAPQRRKASSEYSYAQQTGASIASNSSGSNGATCSDENNDPAYSGDGADSKCTIITAVKRGVHASHSSRSHQDSRTNSDSDFSEEYLPSQHASIISRHSARTCNQKLGAKSAPAFTDAHDLPKSTLRPRTSSLQSTTEVAQLQSQPQVAARSAVSQRCYAPRTVDPRLDSLMRKQFAAVGSTKVHADSNMQHVLDQGMNDHSHAEMSSHCQQSRNLHG